MEYKDLFKTWRESNTEELPEQFTPIKSQKGYAPWVTNAKSAQRYANAFDPMDLYLNPSDTPNLSTGGYSSSAMNLQDDITGMNQIGIIAKGDSGGFYPIEDTVHMYSDIAKKFHKYIPQAQYEHEYVHATNSRLRPPGNKGFLKYMGMSPEVGLEERRAMRGEDVFWGLVKQGII